MAYSNWGSKVWCDSQAKHENCDVTVAQVLEGTHYQHYIEATEDTMYHGIVGDEKSGVMVCLYKAWVSKILIQTPTGLATFQISKEDEDYLDKMGHVEIDLPNGTVVFIKQSDNLICVKFVDPLDRTWQGISGYFLGEGHEEWD